MGRGITEVRVNRPLALRVDYMEEEAVASPADGDVHGRGQTGMALN